MSGDEAFYAATTPEQRARIARGESVEVTMTREQYDAIDRDPMRQLWHEIGREISVALGLLDGESMPIHANGGQA